MRKKTGITFHLPIEKKTPVEVGDIYTCKENMYISVRLKGKNESQGKPLERLLSIKEGVQLQIKKITDSIPRAVVFDATIQDKDTGEIITQEVSYPMGLFQHYFMKVISHNKQQLLGYTKT